MDTDDRCRRVPAGDSTSAGELREYEQRERKTAHLKLWAAIAAVEIDAMDRSASFDIDDALENRLQALGGSVAMRRLADVVEAEDSEAEDSDRPGAEARIRAWMLGEIETLHELAGGPEAWAVAWIDELRGATTDGAERQRQLAAELAEDANQLRQRGDYQRQRAELAEARADRYGREVEGLLKRIDSLDVKCKRLDVLEAAAAEALEILGLEVLDVEGPDLVERAREIAKRLNLAEARASIAEQRASNAESQLAWQRSGVGGCVDALNTEPDEVPR